MEAIVEVVGWTGAGVLLAAYALASAERIAAMDRSRPNQCSTI